MGMGWIWLVSNGFNSRNGGGSMNLCTIVVGNGKPICNITKDRFNDECQFYKKCTIHFPQMNCPICDYQKRGVCTNTLALLDAIGRK
jgi:hypothetical protein